MVKFPEANQRLYKNIFVCRKCKSRKRADPSKVRRGMVTCRNCGSLALRTVRKK